MTIDITYQFASHILANRFLNELKHWDKHEVKAKLFAKASQVNVSYKLERGGFNYTCSDLDDLANTYGGVEC